MCKPEWVHRELWHRCPWCESRIIVCLLCCVTFPFLPVQKHIIYLYFEYIFDYWSFAWAIEKSVLNGYRVLLPPFAAAALSGCCYAVLFLLLLRGHRVRFHDGLPWLDILDAFCTLLHDVRVCICMCLPCTSVETAVSADVAAYGYRSWSYSGCQGLFL